MSLNDSLVLISDLVLAWTLIEIARTRKIQTKQKDMQLLPAFMFYIRDSDIMASLRLRNIGFGAAITVEILSSKFKVESEEHEYRFELKGGNNTLIPNEEREVKPSFFRNGAYDKNYHHHLDQFMAYFNPENIYFMDGDSGADQDIAASTRRELTVQFKDITGQQYNTVLGFSKEGISVLQAPIRVGRASWTFKLRHNLANFISPK